MVALARTSPLKEERPRVAAFPFRGDQSAHRRNRVATIKFYSTDFVFSHRREPLSQGLADDHHAIPKTLTASKFADAKPRRRNQQDQTDQDAEQRLEERYLCRHPMLSAQL